MRDLNGNYTLKTPTPNHWQIGGAIYFNNTAELEKQSTHLRKKLEKNKPWIVEFNDIDHIDSAGLSWLIVNLRFAKANNINIQFQNLKNSKMLGLIKAQGLSDYIKQDAEQ